MQQAAFNKYQAANLQEERLVMLKVLRLNHPPKLPRAATSWSDLCLPTKAQVRKKNKIKLQIQYTREMTNISLECVILNVM